MAAPVVPRVTAFTLAKASEINTIIDQLEALIEFNGLTAGTTFLDVSVEFDDGDLPGFPDLTGSPQSTIVIGTGDFGFTGTLTTGDVVDVKNRDGDGPVWETGTPFASAEVYAKVIDGATGTIGFFESDLSTPLTPSTNLTISVPVEANLGDVPVDGIRREYDSAMRGIKALYRYLFDPSSGGIVFQSQGDQPGGYAALNGAGKVDLSVVNGVLASTHLTDGGNLEVKGEKGIANGYCELDGSVKVPVANISDVINTTNLQDVGSAVNTPSGLLLLQNNPTSGNPQIPFTIDPQPVREESVPGPGQLSVLVTHNLGYHPIVQVRNAGDGRIYSPVATATAVEPEVTYVTNDQFQVDWSAPFTGTIMYK
jgi:hypothetical protein